MKTTNPYQALPAYTRWTKAVAGPAPGLVDPAVGFGLAIDADMLVATAGSCFAQHIARHLAARGFRYYVPETAHPLLSMVDGLAADYNYGTYSCRYGNIYTSRQLLQLWKRAFGAFAPSEQAWEAKNGHYVDPFRPEIQPGGFATLEELEYDRRAHLAAVKRMFETLDVFVFTLGLTEYWYSRQDGAALPVCPGVSGGTFSDEKYGFGNLSIAEVMSDMNEFISLLKEVNPNAKIILTVSPVPLAATAENRHVLVSTTYSKSVLRVAAGDLSDAHNHVHYFPSYEIITGSFNRGGYFASNLRDVLEDGVEHVMGLFIRHATTGIAEDERSSPPPEDADRELYRAMDRVTQVVCEEALLEASLAAGEKAADGS
jgi:hypothetical protein